MTVRQLDKVFIVLFIMWAITLTLYYLSVDILKTEVQTLQELTTEQKKVIDIQHRIIKEFDAMFLYRYNPFDDTYKLTKKGKRK